MAKHLSQQIREAIETALKALPSVSGRVFVTRTWPTAEADYPCILIWDTGGPSQFQSMAGTDADLPLERTETIVLELLVRAGGDERSKPSLGDRLDAIRVEVEPAMMSDLPVGSAAVFFLGGGGIVLGDPATNQVLGQPTRLSDLLEERQLVDTAKDWAVDGDARRGVARLTYRVIYTTPAGDPTVKA